MRIEGRRFLELALHVKLASEAMIEAARHLATLRPEAVESANALVWTQTVEDLMAMNAQLGLMERILRRATRDTAARPPDARRLRSSAQH